MKILLILASVYLALPCVSQTGDSARLKGETSHASASFAAMDDAQKLAELLNTKTTAQGKKVDPKSLAGHHLLLNFYDGTKSDKEVIDMKTLYAMQSKLKGLKVLRIAHMEGDLANVRATWKESIDKDDLTLIHLLDNDASSRFSAVAAYNITELPTTLLLDGTGKVVHTFNGSVFGSLNKIWNTVGKRLMSKDEAADTDDITEADSVYSNFTSVGELSGKVKMLNTIDPRNRYASQINARMQADLALAFCAGNDMQRSESYLRQITDKEIQWNAAYSIGKLLIEKKSEKESLRLVQSFMDEILSAAHNGKLGIETVNAYSQLATLYCQAASAKNSEASIIKYLRPIFETCGFFPTDLHSGKKNPISPDGLLTFKYAMAVSASGSSSEVAKILSSYIHADPNMEQFKAEAINFFNHVKGLEQQLDLIKPAGNELNRQLLFKLFLKKDLNGKVPGLSSIKAKYILIDFWGSWCAPCRASHPNLKEQYEKYKDKGLEIVGISYEHSPDLNRNRFVWKRAVAQDGITWTQFLNPENMHQFNAFREFEEATGAQLVQKLLLDRDGNFIGLFDGKDKEGLNTRLAELMP